mmetsp:Transcript_24235/g.41368  ORF Transcript_24235/g.41368 Transcript_24235/m.41368 type:complete len:555 (-) Transcript_24235:99-1763(-)
MGRKFATFYRFILMTTSVSAVVLSIISATSCAFVTFDHQYKSSATAAGGRRILTQLKEHVMVNLRGRRRVQAPFGGDNVDVNGDPIDFDFESMPGIQLTEESTTTTTAPTDEILPSGELMNGDIPTTDEEQDQTNAANIAALNGGEPTADFDANGFPIVNDPEDLDPTMTAETTETVTAPSDSTAAVWTVPTNGPNGVGGDAMAGTVNDPADTSETAPTNGPNGVGGDTMAGTVIDPADTTETFPTNGPDSVGGDPMAGSVVDPMDTAETAPTNGPNGVGGDPMAGAVAAGQDEDTGDVDFGPGSKGDSMAGEYSGESSTPQISGGGDTYGSSAYGSESTASASGASAIVKGDAGLYCDTDPSFTYTSLWNGGSIKAFEAEIASESDNNKSEEIARNAVLIATIVGAFMATILTIEFLLGWKMCLEKWFIGLLALVACVSQGATFAFFNSQRYCDGDILHEILNQEPCVLGQGGIMSIVALLLYFFTLLLVCKVPQDEPYGLCCKGRKNNDSEKVFQGEGDGMLMGSNSNDAKPERPGWISEDNRSEEEENEII